MRMIKTMLAGAAGVAALAVATPASAQYYQYGYSQPYYAQPYNYAQSYSYAQPYGYNAYAANTALAQRQCTAAVQSRLNNRTSIGGIIGAILGQNTSGRIVGVTSIQPRSYGMTRVRGVASSGRYAYNNYNPYGIGAYGALGYNYANAADLSFRCDVAPNGAVYSVSINRR